MKKVLVRLLKAIGLSILFFAGAMFVAYAIENVWFVGPLILFAAVVYVSYFFVLIYELEKNE